MSSDRFLLSKRCDAVFVLTVDGFDVTCRNIEALEERWSARLGCAELDQVASADSVERGPGAGVLVGGGGLLRPPPPAGPGRRARRNF